MKINKEIIEIFELISEKFKQQDEINKVLTNNIKDLLKIVDSVAKRI